MAIIESPSACIAAEEGSVAKAVLFPGDPLRAKFIAENFLEDIRLVNNVRGVNRAEELPEIGVVQIRVLVAQQIPVGHRPVAVAGGGQRRINGVVDACGGVAALEAAEGEVIVPDGTSPQFAATVLVEESAQMVHINIGGEFGHNHKVDERRDVDD